MAFRRGFVPKYRTKLIKRKPGQGLGRRMIIWPAVLNKLLVWAPGIVKDGTELKDSAPLLGVYPFKMVNGPCITLDGSVVELYYPGHGTLVSYEGPATVSYDNTNITGTAGTMYNLRFSDGAFLPCIGKTPTVNPSVIFDTYGNSAVITASDYEAVWAGSQDTYFYEARFGYWDDVSGRYPYAHSGATFHAGNQFNNSINGLKFIGESVGNFDGVDTLTLYTDHGTLDSDEGDAGVSYVHPTVSATAGWARALTFSDGTVIPLDEGEGTDIHKTVPDLVDAYEFATFGASGSTPDQIQIRVYGSNAVANRRYMTSINANVDVQSYDGIEIALVNPAALTTFYCYSNQLTGSIPDLSANTALAIFSCSSNQLTGSIPDLSANTALTTFSCVSNQLTGSIPDLSANTALAIFKCYSNQITDYVGGVTLSFSSLLDFDASNNALTETAVNNLLIDFDNGTLVVPTTIDISGGTNAAPTGAGLTAKASLIAKGHIVTTN